MRGGCCIEEAASDITPGRNRDKDCCGTLPFDCTGEGGMGWADTEPPGVEGRRREDRIEPSLGTGCGHRAGDGSASSCSTRSVGWVGRGTTSGSGGGVGRGPGGW
eukprot:Hpha_TRINITY_DN25601_c0_g1::TRINITY_DN25601_c0_g1_i1::g.47333::m.47333